MIFENVQPPSAFQKGPGASLFDQNVTDGPFYVSTPYVSGNPQVQLARNPYFNPTPGACGMIMNFVESSSQLSEFLASGTTDLAGPLDPSSVKAILQNQNIHILDEKGQNIMSLQYNITNYPYNMTQFRQALVYGINQSQIQSQALAGYSINAYSAEGDVSPVVPLYNSNIAQYSFNQSKALALLSQIGITQSGGKLHYANGTAVSINLVTDSDQTFDIQAANVVTANLQSMGFTVNSQVLAGSTITGDFPSNQNGIQQAMILYTSIGGAFFPNAWADARPGNIVYQLSYGVGANYWEYPPNVDAEYQGNVSAIDNTSDPAAQQTVHRKYPGNQRAESADGGASVSGRALGVQHPEMDKLADLFELLPLRWRLGEPDASRKSATGWSEHEYRKFVYIKLLSPSSSNTSSGMFDHYFVIRLVAPALQATRLHRRVTTTSIRGISTYSDCGNSSRCNCDCCGCRGVVNASEAQGCFLIL